MEIQEKNQKTFLRYALLIILFFLACFFQYIDTRLPDIPRIIVDFLSNCLFFLILIIWQVSIRERIVDGKTRRYLFCVSSLLLLLMFTRFIKYHLFPQNERVIRLLWYSYYIPECLTPIFMLLAAAQIDRKKEGGVVSSLPWLFIPALVFILLILTNDFHQLCFVFKPGFEDYNSDYQHGILFYIVLSYCALISLATIILLIYKCRVSALKKRFWIPLVCFFASSLLVLLDFLFHFDSVNTPELLYLVIVLSVESLIHIGYIPSNEQYQTYFHQSNLNAVIMDEKHKVYAASNKGSELLPRKAEDLKEKRKFSAYPWRVRSKPIHGGTVYWMEDLSTVRYLKQEIQDITNQISGENDLLIAKNRLEKEKTKVYEQRKLYEMMEKATEKQSMELDIILDSESSFSASDLRLACIYVAYLKRRGNLLMIQEKEGRIPFAELYHSIHESMTYLSLYGVNCSLECLKEEPLVDTKIIELLYDFFEEMVERALPDLKSLLVTFSLKEGKLSFRLSLHGYPESLDSSWREETLSQLGSTIRMDKQDEECHITLISEVKKHDAL